MENENFVFPACENVERKEDLKTWFWTECLESAKRAGCKVGTTEFWVAYKIRVYETHGKFGFCVASIETLAEDVGVSVEQATKALRNLCSRGKLFHIWCDKRVYRNKSKLYVTREWCEERGVDPTNLLVLERGKKNEKVLGSGSQTDSRESETDSKESEPDSKELETDSKELESPLMNKYNRISKNELVKKNEKGTRTKMARFIKPTVDDVRAYCQERNNTIDPENFVDYYESNGWRVGKNPMKDWKACVRTWERRESYSTKPNTSKAETLYQPKPNEDVTYQRAFESWKKYLGVALKQTPEQVAACKDLLADLGDEWAEKLIVALRMRSEHGFLTKELTNIKDFVGLRENALIVQDFYNKHWREWKRWQDNAKLGKARWEL